MKKSFLKELRQYCRAPMMLFIIWLGVFGLLIATPMAISIGDVIPPFFWLTLTIFYLIFAIWVSTGKTKEKERREEIFVHCAEIRMGALDLQNLLTDLYLPVLLAFEPDDFDTLKELAPLFPMAEILSLQGDIGAEQRSFLQDYINLHHPRYNLGQFITAAVTREGIYPEWNALAGLDEKHCGKIWCLLIELVCRQRTPEVMQQAVDQLGKILYHFWLLEHPSIDQAQIRCQSIISNLNLHAESYQKQPYLHAVMLLQMKLAESLGGQAADYIPRLVSGADYSIDGTPGMKFCVRKKEDYSFYKFYAVRSVENLDGLDLIWELPSEDGAPVVFYAE